MKNFWKKVNRGLLLGILLLFLLFGFVIVKEVQFRMETSEIRDRARETVEAMLALNLTEEHTVIGQVRAEAVRERELARMESMLATYWDADAESEYYINVDGIRRSFATYLEDPVLVRFSEISPEIPDREIAVRQNGTDYAVVTMEFDNFSARYQGDGDAVFCGEYVGGIEGGLALGEYVGSYYAYVELELHRTGGEWRACGMSATLYMNNKTVADTETEVRNDG